MATEDLERVVVVCSRGRDRKRHVEVNQPGREERRRAEGTAAAAAAAAP